MMKVLIVLFGLLAWISCHDAADGCSWHFAITSPDSTISLLPSEASRTKIEKELGKTEEYYSFTPVHLKYSLTGAKSTVQCGWGHTATYDEIRVIEIHKK
jgi:hypothetical protein